MCVCIYITNLKDFFKIVLGLIETSLMYAWQILSTTELRSQPIKLYRRYRKLRRQSNTDVILSYTILFLEEYISWILLSNESLSITE